MNYMNSFALQGTAVLLQYELCSTVGNNLKTSSHRTYTARHQESKL